MYVPGHFAMDADDPAPLRALMAEHPLAVLVTRTPDGDLDADHVPLFLDASRGRHGTLVGHVARANPVWRRSGPAMAVFTGPDAYVSPNWYPSKHADGRAVPTWNYTVVHAHGTLAAVDDPGTLLGIVSRLTNLHEARTSHATGATPWRVDDAPTDFIDKMLRAIVGVELTIERLVGKAKLSQNRSDADRAGVADGLAAAGSPPVVDA